MDARQKIWGQYVCVLELKFQVEIAWARRRQILFRVNQNLCILKLSSVCANAALVFFHLNLSLFFIFLKCLFLLKVNENCA